MSLASISGRISGIFNPQKLTVEEKLVSRRPTSPIRTRDAASHVVDIFNKSRSPEEILSKLRQLSKKLDSNTYYNAIQTAKESISFTENTNNAASRQIADILKPKILLYTKEYFEDRKRCCGVDSDSDISVGKQSASVADYDSDGEHVIGYNQFR